MAHLKSNTLYINFITSSLFKHNNKPPYKHSIAYKQRKNNQNSCSSNTL